MCQGCCRYIPDNRISKIPFIGQWLVQKSNAEIGGWIYKLGKIIFWWQIRKCNRGWDEIIKELGDKNI